MGQTNQYEAGGHLFQQESIFTSNTLVFDHHDARDTRDAVGKLFKPHTLNVVKQSKAFSSTLHHVKSGGISICRLAYGSEVIVEPEYLDHFYLIHLPISGGMEVEFDQEKFIANAHTACLLSPNKSLRLHFYEDTPQLILRIEKNDLIQHCRSHLPDAAGHPIVFEPKLDTTSTSGRYFLQLVHSMVDALACDQHPLNHPMAFKQFESNLFNALIYGQPNNALVKLDSYKKKTISPFFIKRAEAYIREHLHEALTIELIAEHVGVSGRSLFTGFKKFLETTPMSYLRECRFEQAHLELSKNEQASVTDVAHKWGFTHLGRFSQEYKARYGELPSFTKNTIKLSGLH